MQNIIITVYLGMSTIVDRWIHTQTQKKGFSSARSELNDQRQSAIYCDFANVAHSSEYSTAHCLRLMNSDAQSSTFRWIDQLHHDNATPCVHACLLTVCCALCSVCAVLCASVAVYYATEEHIIRRRSSSSSRTATAASPAMCEFLLPFTWAEQSAWS